MDWEFRVSRCKLLHTEWINSKDLLYSTGNYIQYPVINHNGKEYSIIDLMDMNLSELQEIVEDREALRAVVYEVTKSQI